MTIAELLLVVFVGIPAAFFVAGLVIAGFVAFAQLIRDAFRGE